MNEILYCGDTSSKGAAAYLLGVLDYGGFTYQYLNSEEKFISSKKPPAKLLILSDYPAKNISQTQQYQIMNWVAQGMSFWMIGGWESFYGLNGEYLGEWDKLLPVVIQNKDDRVNSFQPYILNPLKITHPILKELPWQQGPSVGGFNLVKVKKESKTLMNAIPLTIKNVKGKISTTKGIPAPMLVSGQYKKGKTLAFMADLAPHWSGGFVDWGDQRIKMQAKDANDVEVGHYYTQFIIQILQYLLNPTKKA